MNNILITSAGRRVSLVRFFKTELVIHFPEAKVFTTDINPDFSSACRVSDGFFIVPRATEQNYIDALLQICNSNAIRLIVPTIDPELLVLSKNIQLFKDHNIEIVISDYEVINIFRNKRLTHQFFEKYNINTAIEYDKQNYTLPLYIKPIDGSRSVDNYIILKETDLTAYHFSNDKLMFLEYLDHKLHTEFTIDMYYDRNHELKCIIPRKRIEVRDGEVNKAITQKMDFISDFFIKMAHIEGFKGCITFQIFVNNETNAIYGIEINPRFGGGFPLSYHAGGNFPKWIIQEYLLGETELPICDNWEENLMMLRYDDEILIHDYTH